MKKVISTSLFAIIAGFTLLLVGLTINGLYGRKRLEKNAIDTTLVRRETLMENKIDLTPKAHPVIRQKAVPQWPESRIGNYVRQGQLIAKIENMQLADDKNCVDYDEKNITVGEWGRKCVAGHRIFAQFIRNAQVELSDGYLDVAKLYLEGTELYIMGHEKLGQCFPHLTMDEDAEKLKMEREEFGEMVKEKGKLHICQAEGDRYCSDGYDAYRKAERLCKKLIADKED